MKYYVVLKGRITGIFTNRDECKRQVDGFLGAQYKSFSTEQAAKFARNEQSLGQKGQSTGDYLRHVMGQEFERAICTDAACPSNPGPIEYRGVIVSSGKEIFNHGPYVGGSVNIAEFLAIVEGIQRLLGQEHYNILYTDSTIALGRVLKGILKTSINPSHDNQEVFKRIDESLAWLKHNPTRNHSIQLKKRPTSQRGQIPADFGRK